MVSIVELLRKKVLNKNHRDKDQRSKDIKCSKLLSPLYRMERERDRTRWSEKTEICFPDKKMFHPNRLMPNR